MVRKGTTKYRCGECKLYQAGSQEKIIEHLVAKHQVKPLTLMSDPLGWGICNDCGEYFRGDHLPSGHDSAGGPQMWCYDCAQARCLKPW